MIELNIDVDPAILKNVLETIKESGIVDCRINIVQRSTVTELRGVPQRPSHGIPIMRLKQIARAIFDHAKPGVGLSKDELIALLRPQITPLTAAQYISRASGAGILERTHAGYVLTRVGQALIA